MQIRNLLSIITGGFIILLPFLYERKNIFMDGNDVAFITLAFSAVFVAIASVLIHHRRISITTTDLACIVYLLYGAINVLVKRGLDFNHFLAARWGALAISYILFRMLSGSRALSWALVISAVIQSLYAIGQKAGVFSSNHNAFDITGSFPNPGPLAGYLAIGLVMAICISADIYRKQNRRWILPATCALPVIVALYYADSRAAYLSVAVSLMAWSVLFFTRTWKKYRQACIATIGGIFLLVLLSLYFHRVDSANARILVWQVSTGMMAESPLMGHGVDSFEEKYMLYQAEWLERHSDSPLSRVAGHSSYAYNEFIHVGVEQGIVGLLLFLAIIASVLRYENRERRALQISLIALLVFSMFSYPADIFPLAWFFPLLLGLARGKVILEKTLPRYAIPVACLGLLFTSTTGVFFGWSTLREQSEIIAKIVRKDYGEHVDSYVCDNYNSLKYNGVFSNHYIPWARAKQNTDNPHIEVTAFPSCEIYCDLGDYFHDKGEVRQAETYYKTASHMIPTRLTPKYKLWKLYIESKQDEKARKIARAILDAPLKVETVFTIRAKAEVKTYLETQR